ncbi:phosphoribosyl-AMP cyclohydrolase [Aureimonas ureilytica]|uniref:Phosphoribosyl-AMP cyclohydrolase n=1 Tax=Aureimonas ureilytica TaxID=401562 RepID=A0A175RFU5_9HYPH|nr:phosphoribosyl-AMP cyclohydrolase [Aureimonas ureilytica]KTQ95110.1 phosphoribosyl-AMP cyclohydrolase [Aureimonas ureilytica]KTR02358.1 phosphoribosyl-AMP cyclohydrolase [Aureimonas ureilytica]
MSDAASFATAATKAELEEGVELLPRFDASGLVTAVVTDAASGELLMVAHMNAQALDLTLSTGIAHYFSRSRQSLWKKGETSGALQMVREVRVDCDQDAVWLKVDVAKPEDTCHTGRTTCFYRKVVSSNGRFRLLDTEPRAATQHS